MAAAHRPVEGETHTIERTFTPEDVRQFGDISGDQQPAHTEPDAEGRLLVQGLLTATLPTSIGGDLEVLAREMTFEFHAPVFTGETVTCEWETEAVTERHDRYELVVSIACTCDGELVLSGDVEGLIWKDD